MKMTGGSWQFKPLSRAPAAALVAQTVKNPPAMQETQVQSMGWEDSLEKRMATHSSIDAWEIPWTEEPGGAAVHGVAMSCTRLNTYTHTHTSQSTRSTFAKSQTRLSMCTHTHPPTPEHQIHIHKET